MDYQDNTNSIVDTGVNYTCTALDNTKPESTVFTKKNAFIAVGVIVIIVLCMLAGACLHSKFTSDPKIEAVQSVDIPNVSTALKDAGLSVSNETAGAIVDKIQYVVQHDKPDVTTVVANEAAADAFIKQYAKTDGADVVIKEKPKETAQANSAATTSSTMTTKNGTTIDYYGIHMEKKTGIGVYTDLTKDGSYGVHMRKDRTVVEVGQKYTDKSITARVAYELIQY